jgi:aryl-alcohol dehydrogenase-like predicted oxidoreductase
MDGMNSTGIVLGTMDFGTRVAPDQAFAVLDSFVAAGGVWLDTANCYSFWNDPGGVGGASERVIGAWLRARPGARDAVRIATKVRQNPLVPHSWPQSAEGLSARAVHAGVQESLRRLGVDHVDLLWAHAEDRSVPLEETVGAFGELVAKGTALRVGAANHAAWRVERARSSTGTWARPTCNWPSGSATRRIRGPARLPPTPIWNPPRPTLSNASTPTRTRWRNSSRGRATPRP